MNKLFVLLALASLLGCAQAPTRTAISSEAAAERHAQGVALERSGDDKAAFAAFLDAAEHGNPPAQRKLGEIYDTGNTAVARDYAESVRWYQLARENGEQLPEQPKVPSSSTAARPNAWY
jgi:TPR repeat protein